jgi:hypothetical protein
MFMQGRGLGSFHDIHKLTMFADYRVPVVLRELGVLKYDEDLGSRVHPPIPHAETPGPETPSPLRATGSVPKQ